MLDLRTRHLVEPQSIITKRLGTAFDADADCPAFKDFVSQIFDGQEDVITFVQRAIGYTLSGETNEQCLLLCVGKGANGKSTLHRVMHRVWGNYGGSVPMHTLMQSRYGSDRTDDLAALRGKRFVSAQEGEAGEKLAEAKIKLMTGGDPIACRKLYGTYEEYDPQFKLWLATNDLPRIAGTDDAIWRRIYVIVFPVTFPSNQRDPKLVDKLLMELPGILNWALDGLQEWLKQGLNPPESVT